MKRAAWAIILVALVACVVVTLRVIARKPAASATMTGHSDRGYVILGGHELSAPYTIDVVSTELVVNGYIVEDEPQAVPANTTPIAATRNAVLDRVLGRLRELSESGAGDSVISASVVEEYRRSNLVDSAQVAGPLSVFVYWKGDSMPEYASFQRPSPDHDTAERIHQSVVDHLQKGGMVVIGYGFQSYIPPDRVEKTLAAIAELRRSGSAPEDSILPRDLQRQILEPLKLNKVATR
jgi:hypothetical protein